MHFVISVSETWKLSEKKGGGLVEKSGGW